MIQAARSGVQNIAEGSMASATSKKTELKLRGGQRAWKNCCWTMKISCVSEGCTFGTRIRLKRWQCEKSTKRIGPSDRSEGSDLSDPYGISTIAAELCKYTNLPDQPGELLLGRQCKSWSSSFWQKVFKSAFIANAGPHGSADKTKDRTGRADVSACPVGGLSRTEVLTFRKLANALSAHYPEKPISRES